MRILILAPVLAAGLLVCAPAWTAPQEARSAAATVGCADQELTGHIWSISSTAVGGAPVRCAAAIGLVRKLNRRPAPKAGTPYPTRLYSAEAATGIRCFGGPKVGKAPESLTCVLKRKNRRSTIRGTCSWCQPLPDGLPVRAPVSTSQPGSSNPPIIARFQTMRCLREGSPTRPGVFSAIGKANGVTLEIGIGQYRGPAFEDGVYSVPYGQILTTITVQGPGGFFSNAYTPPNWEPGGPSGFIALGEDARGRATDRFFGAFMAVLNADRSLVVGVGGLADRTAIAVCKYR